MMLLTAMQKWYQSQDRFVIMYDHSLESDCFIVSDRGYVSENFPTRDKALEWCYNQRGADDDSNV